MEKNRTDSQLSTVVLHLQLCRTALANIYAYVIFRRIQNHLALT